MPIKRRIPVTAITVVSTSVLLAVSVATVLYLGFDQAARSTQERWAETSETIISSIEASLASRLNPVRQQALWVAQDVKNLSNLARYDDYMFGALAATPQLAGVALITKQGMSRRWHRNSREVIDEDWSKRPEIGQWLEQVEIEKKARWREPIWVEHPVSATTLLHDIPIYNTKGEFIGVFAQIVTTSELSSLISLQLAETGLTPFILYNRQYVLSHPMLASQTGQTAPLGLPLQSIENFDDIILSRIWTPDDEAEFFSAALTGIEAKGVLWGDTFYIYLYRDNNQYGPAPWTIGAYLNTSLIADDSFEQLVTSIAFSLLVLIIAIVISVLIGHRVSAPVKAIALAAQSVQSGDLNAVQHLRGNPIREIDDANHAINNMVEGLRERELIRKTLGRFVPEEVARSLLDGGGDIEPTQTEATILFCDIEAFTQLTEILGPAKVAEVLNAYFSAMVNELELHGGVVTQFQGDAILATFNVPLSNSKHASNAIHAARNMLKLVNEQRFAGQVLNIRIGINSGTVFAGAIGAEGRLNYTVHGDAVNLAARLENMNKEYGTRVIISEHTQLLDDQFELSKLGETSVRGQSKHIAIFTLSGQNNL